MPKIIDTRTWNDHDEGPSIYIIGVLQPDERFHSDTVKPSLHEFHLVSISAVGIASREAIEKASKGVINFINLCTFGESFNDARLELNKQQPGGTRIKVYLPSGTMGF